MKKGKGKDELLGESAKSKLKEIWIQETYGRQKFDSKMARTTEKGIKVESDSLDLIERVTGEKLFKNVETFSNDFIRGAPDVIDPRVKDVKSSWDIFTFTNVDYEKAHDDYYWQMLGYMILRGAWEADLIYVLNSTPPEITEGELYKLSFYLSDEEQEIARRNFEYEDIDPKLRIKSFVMHRFEEAELRLIRQIGEARDYLQTFNG